MEGVSNRICTRGKTHSADATIAMQRSPPTRKPPQRAAKPPVPPRAGWSLLEAAMALCPEAAQIFVANGPELAEAVLAEGGIWAKRSPWPEGWLSSRLVDALRTRPDLVLTGRDFKRNLRARRFHLEFDVLRMTASTNRGLPCVHLYLNVADDTGKIYNTIAEFAAWDIELADARIERGQNDQHDDEFKPPYTTAACIEWLKKRVSTWPATVPPPSGKQCISDARRQFAGTIRRDPFLALRGVHVPLNWCKPGPRRPEN